MPFAVMRLFLLMVTALFVWAHGSAKAESQRRSSSEYAREEYGRLIKTRIATMRAWAPTQGHAGRVVVRIHIGKSGNVVSRRIAVGSKDPYLNAAALALVDRMPPFPPVPDAIRHEVYAELPLVFKGR